MVEFLVTLKIKIKDAKDIKYLEQSIQEAYEFSDGEYVHLLEIKELIE